MTIENANLSKRKGVLVPTRAELTEAARRGKPLSSKLLREMRSEARTKTQVATRTVRPVPPVPPGLAAATTVMRLQNQIAALRNENTRLKVKIMSAG